MSISSFFATSCETRELHLDPELRTHYYRNSFRDVAAAFEMLAGKERFDVKSVDPIHGEIYLIGDGFDAIVTVAQINPIESGIDLKINYFSFTGLGRPKKKAIALFKTLDAHLKFKGVSLHP
jgi:hypothetical protein